MCVYIRDERCLTRKTKPANEVFFTVFVYNTKFISLLFHNSVEKYEFVLIFFQKKFEKKKNRV